MRAKMKNIMNQLIGNKDFILKKLIFNSNPIDFLRRQTLSKLVRKI